MSDHNIFGSIQKNSKLVFKKRLNPTSLNNRYLNAVV